ncbi:MAG: GNAT family N-acetyltransferase [Bryobacteraceae bacterium]|nr:GNAT family N-acetyltransferase [Bryobacteraceae bacterium]
MMLSTSTPGRAFKPVLETITPAMAASVKEVRLAALQEAPGAFGSTYAEESQLSEADWVKRASAMSLNGAVGYLVLDEERPCGIVRGNLDKANPLRAHVASMWVAPEYRRAGVASRLLSAVQSWASRSGAGELLLMVTNNNEAAISLYLRHGFQVTGRTEPYPNDPALFEIEMMKRLA